MPSSLGKICFLKGSFLKQIFIYFYRIKDGISQKCFRIDKQMLFKKVFPYRNELLSIRKAFILIREVGFLFNHNVPVYLKKSFVVKGNISNNAKPICNNTEFIGIAEVSVNIYLLNGMVSGNMGKHETGHRNYLDSLLDELYKAVDKLHGRPAYDQIVLLQSLRSIGWGRAVVLIAEMGSFNLFPSPKKLYAYFGLDPAVKLSDKFNGDKVHMSKRGSNLARRICT